MFDGEMVKRNFPFQDKFGQKILVQDKVGLRKFSPKFYFAKSLKMSCLMGKW